MVIVQGDTSSALGGALAARAAEAPLAHVEAGLRSFDVAQPWPEEEYRVAIDAHADLLLAPTEIAAANLRCERAPGEIYVTGNTSVDALLALKSRLPPPVIRQGPPLLLVTCHRRESWREGLKSIAAALRLLTANSRIDFVLHPNPHVSTAMRRLLGGVEGLSMVDPCSHLELLARMRDADLVLSDSGGIQEEAPTLGVPLLVLRDKTERPEGIACGSAILVGTSTDRIVHEARRLLGRAGRGAAVIREPKFPYGDGQAAPRIARIIDDWLTRREAGAVRAGPSAA